MTQKLEKLNLPKFKVEDFEIKSTLGTGINQIKQEHSLVLDYVKIRNLMNIMQSKYLKNHK